MISKWEPRERAPGGVLPEGRLVNFAIMPAKVHVVRISL
jgi:hypothetical protein